MNTNAVALRATADRPGQIFGIRTALSDSRRYRRYRRFPALPRIVGGCTLWIDGSDFDKQAVV
jgi:hypothetical protein